MSTSSRPLIVAAGIFGFTGVALGAFGAHALKETLELRGTLSTWQTAVSYQLIHAVALLALAGKTEEFSHFNWVSRLWMGGIVLFSCSLYALALGGPKIFGPVTPLGGLCFLAGWALLVVNAWGRSASP